ncbi:MAG TPA: penicillin-binding protein 1B [Solimonas sp.]|nr:penicillin-binding protein 1B [Solimonas sp.]
MAWNPKKLKIAAISALLLVGSVAILAFATYLMRLDGQIRERFAGARWALPAQVYAAPMELYPGLALTAPEFAHQLERLGYREDALVATPGTFAAGPSHVDLHLRAFQFWDGAQPAQRLSVQFNRSSVKELQGLDDRRALEILRLDPALIGSIYPKQGEDRVLVRLDAVPPLLTKGLIAIEDQAFYWHMGVSIKAILRASFANLRAGHVVQGGSTITQQLIKNFFLNSKQTWDRKLNEAFMALLLEIHYEKQDILEAYLNEVHLGQDGSRAVHGFGLGAQFYFNKPLDELRPHEIALLVGLVKGPSFYNPRRNPKRALERRNLVLGVLHREELLSDEDYAAALDQPLGVVQGRGGGVERYPAFVELVRRQLSKQYQEQDLTHEGLRIFTTLDPRAQEALERRIIEALPELEKSRRMKERTLEAAGIVTSPDGGEVLALVAGRDVRFPGFNRALDSRRPIGSLVKPFVYLSALQRPADFNLHSLLADEPIALKLANGRIWQPKNYDRQLHGPQPLYMALAQSYNLPTVQVGLALGADVVLQTLREAGYQGGAQPLPSLFLGSLDASPLDVAQMYSTIASGGFRAPLSAIREVQTQDGKPLTRFPIEVEQTLPEGPVYLLTWALRQVMTLGTGRPAYAALLPTQLVAGKTGTTDDYRDSWFAGFGADRVAVIWVGRDDNQPTGLSGANGALPIWARVMRDLRVRSLDPIPPPDVEEAMVDPATGLRADAACLNAIVVPYLAGTAPAEWAPCAEAEGFFGREGDSPPLQWLKDLFGG